MTFVRSDIIIPATVCAAGFAAYVEATTDNTTGVEGVDARRVVKTFTVSLIIVYSALWLLMSNNDSVERIAIKNIRMGEPGF